MERLLNSKENKLLIIIIIVILLIGAFFRFYVIQEKGFFSPDSSFHFRESKTIASLSKWGLTKFLGTQKMGLGEYLNQNGDAIPSLPKEGFLVFSSLSVLVFGAHDYAILGVSAFFGTLTILLLYLIGRQLYNRKVGILAALILAVSSYHISYSRLGLSHITTTFFLFLGLYFYILSLNKKGSSALKSLAIAGVSAGYAFTCHYGIFFILGLFFFLESFNRELSWPEKLKRLAIFYFFVFVPILLFQALTYFIKVIVMKNPNLWTSSSYIMEHKQDIIMTYFQQIKLLFKGNLAFTKDINPGILFYPFCIWHYEGSLVTILLVIGLLVLAGRQFRRFSYTDFLLVFAFFYILTGYSFSHGKFARTLIIISPIIALIVARIIIASLSFSGHLREHRFKGTILVSLVFSIVFLSIYNSWKEFSFRSGYRKALEFIEKTSGKADYMYMTNDPNLSLAEAYVDRKRFPGHKKLRFESLEQAKEDYEKKGIRYLIVDEFKYFFPEAILRKIEQSKVVFETFHSSRVLLYDGFHLYKGMVAEIENKPNKLEVYDLKDIFKE